MIFVASSHLSLLRGRLHHSSTWLPGRDTAYIYDIIFYISNIWNIIWKIYIYIS
jgi:hypothetical protein